MTNHFTVKHGTDQGVIITGEFPTWWEAEHDRVEWLREHGAFGSWIEYKSSALVDRPVDLPIGVVGRGHLGEFPTDAPIAHSTLELSGYCIPDLPTAEHCPRKGYWLDVDKLGYSVLSVEQIVSVMEFKGYRVYRQGEFITFAV